MSDNVLNKNTEAGSESTDKIVYQKLDPKAIRLWRLSRFIGLIILIILLIAGYLITANRFNDLPGDLSWIQWYVIGSLIIIAFQLLNILVYPIIEYRQWSYCLTPDRIEIKKGIIFHQTTIIPITRIQHVTVNEGPLARLYKLAGLDIMTAGSSSKIDCLSADIARQLCDQLKTAVNFKVLNKKANSDKDAD